ncbi:uncharacterized protein LOC133319414 [Danaus plexippus]|uniref:uncharacterized protein LOC133319414 n=1 Tax=Danaus plexippus TaxID=13037 RepID=UPI002AB1E24C|nr:uncharacterized protein LOC133319414 [Danaus plexippus]
MVHTAYNAITTLTFTMVEIFHDAIILIYIIQNLMVVSIPTIFATMLTTEANNLKLLLHDRLLIERASSVREDIKRFVAYIDARPFQLYVCRLIPLDYKFPLILINIYVSYAIALAQFSNTDKN